MSVAWTSSEWLPPASPEYVTGVVHAVNVGAASRRHAYVTGDSLDVNENVAEVEELCAPGPDATVVSGGTVTFSVAFDPGGDLEVFDLSGRRVGRIPFRGGAGSWSARWEARDPAGAGLAPGLYFARAGVAGITRLVVLAR